jgi:hypothetical protein
MLRRAKAGQTTRLARKRSASAAERVRQVFCDQVLPAVTAVAPDAPATRAALISSHFLGVAYCRFVVAIPELVKLDEGILLAALGRNDPALSGRSVG